MKPIENILLSPHFSAQISRGSRNVRSKYAVLMGSGSVGRSRLGRGTFSPVDRIQALVNKVKDTRSFILQNATTVKSYFPKSVWFDAYTLEWHESQGDYITISAPMDKIPLFLRAGFIVPFQEPGLTTEER